jgi:hypothetical protein
MKKGTGLLLVLAIFLALQPVALAGAPGTQESGNFEYALRQDGTACLTQYLGTAKALSLPGEIDGHVVKAVGADAFPKGLSVLSILIPGSIQEIGEGTFRYLDKLNAIGVMTANPVYASEQAYCSIKPKSCCIPIPEAGTEKCTASPGELRQ